MLTFSQLLIASPDFSMNYSTSVANDPIRSDPIRSKGLPIRSDPKIGSVIPIQGSNRIDSKSVPIQWAPNRLGLDRSDPIRGSDRFESGESILYIYLMIST